MKGWSSNLWAVGRANGSLCKHSLMKFFASFERCSGISGISLLFPILNMAATCSIQHKNNFSHSYSPNRVMQVKASSEVSNISPLHTDSMEVLMLPFQ